MAAHHDEIVGFVYNHVTRKMNKVWFESDSRVVHNVDQVALSSKQFNNFCNMIKLGDQA